MIYVLVDHNDNITKTIIFSPKKVLKNRKTKWNVNIVEENQETDEENDKV